MQIYFDFVVKMSTVTPFKFMDIKVRGFDIMTYSPFNFAVSYQKYFTVSYTNVFFYTN